MKFSYTAPTFILSAVFVVLVAITGLAHFLTSKLVHEAHEGDYELMRNAFTAQLHALEDEATSDAEIVANMPAVRKAFIARDRAALQAETLGMFRTIEPKYSIDQAQFATPPGVAFLRLELRRSSATTSPPTGPCSPKPTTRRASARGRPSRRAAGHLRDHPDLDDAGQLSGTFEMGLEFGPRPEGPQVRVRHRGAVFFDEKTLRGSPRHRAGRHHPQEPRRQVHPLLRDPPRPARVHRHGPGRRDHRGQALRARRQARAVGRQMLPLYNCANKRIGVVALATNFDQDKTLARRYSSGRCSPRWCASWCSPASCS